MKQDAVLHFVPAPEPFARRRLTAPPPRLAPAAPAAPADAPRTEAMAPLRYIPPRVSAAVGAIEWAYAMLGLAWLAQLNMSLIYFTSSAYATYEDRTAGSLFNQLGSLVVFGPCLLLLTARFVVSFAAVRRTALVWLALMVPIVSALWSLEPEASLRRGSQMLLTSLFVFWCATRFPPRHFVQILSATFAAIIIASLAALLVPGVGLENYGPHIGDLRGILPNKNEFGLIASIAILIFHFHADFERGSERRLLRVFTVLTLGLLIVADARSPLVGLVAALVALKLASFLWAPRGWQVRFARHARLGLAMLFAVALIAAVLVGAQVVLGLMGRDLTLTGRLSLWDYALTRPVPNAWLGAGYRSFWGDALTFDLRVRHAAWTGNMPGMMNLTSNGHNGFLDSWLEMGVPGVAALVALVWRGLANSIGRIRARDRHGALCFALIAMLLVYSMANSVLFAPCHIAWGLLLYPAMLPRRPRRWPTPPLPPAPRTA